jgi:hypothetical protein
MFPIEIYLAIILIDGLLTVYGVVSVGVDYWKNIVALFFAGFLSVYIAMVSVAGSAYVYATNQTISVSTLPIQDDGLMWIFYMFATAQGIYLFVEGVEAYELYIHKRKERQLLKESGDE